MSSRVLSLALKINADASGLKLDPVEKALQRLGQETDKVTAVFDKFAGTSEVAARAQEQTAKAISDLTEARRTGAITAQQFAEQFEAIANAANAEASALQRAAQITEANLTPLERYDRSLAELNEQLNAGRISQETYSRAVEGSAKGLTDAERAARGLAVQQNVIEQSASKTTLKFNELSGVFAALPGPLGNVAGRISGLASAGEGLSRIFAGGLSQGVSTLGSSVAALVNPFTLAAAGIAGFGAAAASIVNGLTALEDRVENLGNIADKLGVSFGFIQTLDEAARRSGTSIDAVSAAFGRLQKSVLGVDEESKSAQKALAQIGVTAEELQRLSPEEQYRRIGSALAEIEDPARRTATATALFGRAGADLLPFFRNLQGAAVDVERFGAALSDADRGQIDQLGASFDEVFVALRGLGQSVLVPFSGLVEGVAKSFSGLINVVRVLSDAFLRTFRPVLDGLGFVFGEVGNAVNGIIGVFEGFFTTAERSAQSAATVQKAVSEATKIDDAPARRYAEAVGQINTNLQQAFREASKFGEQGLNAARVYSATVAKLRDEFAQKIIGEETFKLQVEQATAAYEEQIGVVRQLAEEAKRRAQAEIDAVDRLIEASQRAIRVQQQFAGDEARANAADNLLRINDEFARVEQRIAEARRLGDQATVNALTNRLALLDQAAAKEEDIVSGQAAAREAATRAAAEDAKRREQQNRQIAERRLQIEKEVEQQIAAERDRVNQFVNNQLALAQFGGNQQRLEAARRVAEIEREIARVQQEIQAARDAGNQAAANAGVARIAQLDQVAAKERDIANGRAEIEDRLRQQREQAIEAERQAAAQFQKAVEQQQQAASQQAQAQQKAFEEQARAAAAEAERQERRIRALNSIGQQSVSVGDIRSTEGARQFIQAAAGAFDPNLAELRTQTKLLRQAVANSGALRFLEQGIGTTIQFLGGGA